MVTKIKSEKKALQLADQIEKQRAKLEMLAVFVDIPEYALALVENSIETLTSALEVVSAVSTEVVKAGGMLEPDTSSEIVSIDTDKVTTLEDLQKRLRKGYVQFSYKKKNGDVRKAVGTTCIELIPAEKHPKNDPTFEKVLHAPAATEQKYFDHDVMDWRAFVKTNLVVPEPLDPSDDLFDLD